MRSRTTRVAAIVAAAVLGSSGARPVAGQSGTGDSQGGSPAGIVLAPTNHPRVPADLSLLWLVPGKSRAPRPAALTEFAEAVKLEVNSEFARALPIVSQPAIQQGVLGPYAEYYEGLAQLRLGRAAEARATFRALGARSPVGYVSEAAALREGESNEALGDPAGALAVYEKLSKTQTTSPDDVLMRLGRAARAAGDNQKAVAAFSRVYFEFPFGDLASQAGAELQMLPNYPPIAAGTSRYKLELGRAERLLVESVTPRRTRRLRAFAVPHRGTTARSST